MEMNDKKRLLDALKTDLSEGNIQRWFEPSLFYIEDEKAVICAPNNFSRDWIENNYRPLLEKHLPAVCGKQLPLQIIASPSVQMELPGIKDETESSHKTKEKKKGFSTKEYRLLLNPKFTFENFVVGQSNQFAHAACVAVAEKPAEVYNPLFIYGDVGLGKTHLLNAIGHKLLEGSSPHRVIYTSSEQFTNELVYCLRFEKMNEFRKKYREDIDVLLMDDIQFLAGKDKTQEEFFHTFNALINSKKQIIVSSNQFPKDIDNLDQRLVSRLVWGLIVDIQPPDLETKLAILRKKAEENKLALSDELALFIATNVGSNVRELEGSLTRVFAFASLTKQEPTIELAREALKGILGKQQALSIETIQKVVASFFNIKVSDLKSQRKLKLVAQPRQICMYLARKLTNCSYPEIGSKFGGKDHSTVIHAVRKIEKRLEEDPKLRNTIATIEKNLCG